MLILAHIGGGGGGGGGAGVHMGSNLDHEINEQTLREVKNKHILMDFIQPHPNPTPPPKNVFNCTNYGIYQEKEGKT